MGASYYTPNKTPNVYFEDVFPPRAAKFRTGVPAFLGSVSSTGHAVSAPVMLTLWPQFRERFRWTPGETYVPECVHGFFENGGQVCYVIPLSMNSSEGLVAALDSIASLNAIDLVCVPDVSRSDEPVFDLQQMVVNHCEAMNNRFAILDSLPGDAVSQAPKQWHEIDGHNGAVYFPWVKVQGSGGGKCLVPPCGHVAGVYARTDRRIGVHKAPANELLEGVLELQYPITNADQDALNANGINCLRAFPGRGIRVWGARTLSGRKAWTYVNVRRVFLTAIRWIALNMEDVVFEPNEPGLWKRIERELRSYFLDQFRRGALKGRTPDEAFYVKCNAETNPPETRDQNQIVTEIGLAPASPHEFVVVRLIHGDRGVEMLGPTGPA